jgi:hypothetical protein
MTRPLPAYLLPRTGPCGSVDDSDTYCSLDNGHDGLCVFVRADASEGGGDGADDDDSEDGSWRTPMLVHPTASPPNPRDDASRGGAGSDGTDATRVSAPTGSSPRGAAGDADASGASEADVEAAARVLWEASEAWFDEFAPEPWDIDAAKPELHPDDIDTATDTRNRYRAIARAVLAHVDRAHVAEVDRATEWWKGACEELQLRLRAAEMAADVRGEALIEWKRDLEWTDDRWQEAEANLRLAMTHGLAECERLRAECARLKADRDAKQAAIAAWITRPTGRDER